MTADALANAALDALADGPVADLHQEHRTEWGAQRGDWASDPGSVIPASNEDQARSMAQRLGGDGMGFTVVSREVTVLTSPWVAAQGVDRG